MEGPEEESTQAVGDIDSKDDQHQLKGTFEEQQQIIGHLDAISKAHEKGMEDYTLRLAKMKPRLLRGRGRGRGKQRTIVPPKVQHHIGPSSETTSLQYPELPEYTVDTADLLMKPDDAESTADPEQEPAVLVDLVATPETPKGDSSRSNVLLLRRQVEENRAKFDKQQRENFDKRQALEEMKDRVERLTEEVDSRDQLIQSLHRGDTSGVDPDTHVLYQQILHKDNTILDLTEKVTQLEMHIQDQREELSEKEQIIAARTEAVNLVAKDRDLKLMSTVTQLDETTHSMQQLQKLCESNKSDWKYEANLLSSVIKENEDKIKVLEENSKRTEAVRFQLSARNAELQDKLVAVQMEMDVVKSKLLLTDKKLVDKSEDISELNKKVNRAEAFGQKKLKTFEKYFKSVETEDLGERILLLSNDIALLEEEKGNLQLKLVDCDEIHVVKEKLASENMHMEAKFDNLNLELKSVSALVRDLEKEKIFLVDSLNESNLERNTTDKRLKSLLQELKEANQKVYNLELSSHSLEDERDLALNKLEELETTDKNIEVDTDIFIRDKANLEQMLRNRDGEMSGLHVTINSLQIEHDKQIEIANLALQKEEKTREESDSLLQLLTNKEEHINLQSIELNNTQDAVAELENKLSTVRIMKHDYECRIKSLEENLSKCMDSMDHLRNENVNLQEEDAISKEGISSLRKVINELNVKLEDRIELASRLQSTVSVMEDELHGASITIENTSHELEESYTSVMELNEQLSSMDVKYRDICTESELVRDEFQNYEETTKKAMSELKSELKIVSALIYDKDNQVSSFRADIEIKEEQLRNSAIMLSKFELENCECNRKVDDLNKANTTFKTELNMISAILADKENIIATLHSDVDIKEQQLINNQIMISNFETENCANNSTIDKLMNQCSTLELEIKSLKDKAEEQESAIQSYQKEIKDLQNLIIERETSIVDLKTAFESTSNMSAKLQIDLEESQTICLSLQETNAEQIIQIESIRASHLELKSINLNYESELAHLKEDIADKQCQISYMENIAAGSELRASEQQALMSDTSKLMTLQENYDDLGSKLSEITNQLKGKELEIDTLKDELNKECTQCTEAANKFIENNQQIDSLSSKLAHNDNQISDLLVEMETSKQEKIQLSCQIEDLSLKLCNAESSHRELSDELSTLKLSTDSSLHTETYVKASSAPLLTSSDKDQTLSCLDCQSLSAQKMKLEKELVDAQQAIVRLETSLATQSPLEESAKEGWSDWGDVDLGQKNEFEPSLQTTLQEKDRVLTMTQEQLKDSLEQVNTVVDEKKLIEQKMKVLEAELQHKQVQIDSHLEEIHSLKGSLQHMEGRYIELQTSTACEEQTKSNATLVESGMPVIEFESDASASESTAVKPLDSETASIDTGDNSQTLTILQEVQYKLNWYEEMWPQWTENYNEMSLAYRAAQEQVSTLQQHINDAEEKTQQLVADAKVATLTREDRSTEAESYLDTQTELVAIKNQTVIQEDNLTELRLECERLQPFEILCSELQTNIQGLEGKRDGTSARILELELMVQSAESEISRLRSDMQSLTNAGNSLETERSCLKEGIANLNEEIRKINTERERLVEENVLLQQQAAVHLSSTTQMEDANRRLCSENSQLRSEIEVLEGDGERARVSWEIVETESNRITAENEVMMQNSQMLEAEKESLAHELQRMSNQLQILTSERDHLKGEAQRLMELSTSAESEISRLKIHLEGMTELTSRHHQLENQYTELQSKLTEMESANSTRRSLTVEEIDWSAEGNLESEHFQASQQSEEISMLNEQIIQLEKKKNSLGDEIYAAKLKNGKMIQKLKTANNKVENLQKELEKCKPQGLSDLDAAIEAEWKAQILKAETERDEYKVKADELEKEKYNLISQIDMLHSAEEKYLELKESQDSNQLHVIERNKSLETQISSMEWRIAELEESLEEKDVLQPQTQDVTSLVNRITELENQLRQMSAELNQTKADEGQIRIKLEEAETECNKMRLMLSEMKELKEKLESDCETYKSTYLELHAEHESLIETEKNATGRRTAVEQELNSLKFSYDSIYNEYNVLQLDRDAVKYDLGIMVGEKEKLQEELTSLHNIQAALKEEEQETIIIALQEECAVQRQQNNDLKDELTRFGESVRQAEEDSAKAKHTLDQQLDIQEMVRNELNDKIMDINHMTTTMEAQEKDIKYERAEVAALKSKISQMQPALELSRSQASELQAKYEHLQEAQIQFKEAASPSVRQDSGISPTLPVTDVEITAHLTELRCRQMSLEINKLLEERDALQLKLSSILRQNQELGRELSLSQQLPTPPPPNALKKKLAELRELNSSLEQKAMTSPISMYPPSPPSFVSRTAPPTPTASRQTGLSITRDSQGSTGLVGWILGRGPGKEVLHV